MLLVQHFSTDIVLSRIASSSHSPQGNDPGDIANCGAKVHPMLRCSKTHRGLANNVFPNWKPGRRAASSGGFGSGY